MSTMGISHSQTPNLTQFLDQGTRGAARLSSAQAVPTEVFDQMFIEQPVPYLSESSVGNFDNNFRAIDVELLTDR